MDVLGTGLREKTQKEEEVILALEGWLEGGKYTEQERKFCGAGIWNLQNIGDG